MIANLKRPLAFISTKTTGDNYLNDRITELTVTKYNLDGTFKTAHKVIKPDSDTENFQASAKKIYEFVKDADYAGCGIISKDLRFLVEEFSRAGIEFSVVGKKVMDLDAAYNNEIFAENRVLDIGGGLVLNENKKAVFTFGPYKGKVVSDSLLSDKPYYDKLLGDPRIPSDTKSLLKKMYSKATKTTGQPA